MQDHRSTLARVAAGSETAFLALVQRHEASLMRVAALWIEDPSEAAELVAKTWLALLQRLDRFDEAASLKGWLCGALIALVRQKLGPTHAALVPALPPDDVPRSVDPERFSPVGDRWEGHWRTPPKPWPSYRDERTFSAELLCELQAALAALPPAWRAMLVLRDVEGLSVSEVERALELDEAEQTRLLHRGRSQLRAVMERHHARELGTV